MRTTAFCFVVSFACVTAALAVDPPPDGGYPNGNTAEGDDALFSLTSAGANNTAVGVDALFANTSGFGNTALGFDALSSNTMGGSNVAIGGQALQSNTTGGFNTAIGNATLLSNTVGPNNTAVGWSALASNNTGEGNTATGLFALDGSTTGNENTATGIVALQNNTTGSDNTADGGGALQNNTAGNGNVAVGWGAGVNITGNGNIALGFHAGMALTSGSNNIDISAIGVGGESKTMRLGRHDSKGPPLLPASAGNRSSGRACDHRLSWPCRNNHFIGPLQREDSAYEGCQRSDPVTEACDLSLQERLDPEAIPQFGLVAEDVAKVDPDLVAKDEEGKPYTVRYEAVNAMLLNEFLKEHRKGEEREAMLEALNATVAEQQKEIGALTASLKEEAAQIQKVTARQVAGESPRVVADGE